MSLGKESAGSRAPSSKRGCSGMAWALHEPQKGF
jgi:hypothetical protein